MSTTTLSLSDWSFDPTVTLGLLGACALYWLAIRRGALGATDDVGHWFTGTRPRRWLFGTGVLCGFLALQSPIDVGGDRYLFSIHMVQHILLMMVAPPLLILGCVGARVPNAGMPPWLGRLLARLSRPWPATVLFNVVLCVWHLPALYNTTLTNEGLHIVEHLSFIAVGLLFWWSIVDPLRPHGSTHVSPFTKIAMLVVGGVPPTALGFVFAMGQHPFYDFYASAPRLWGISALADQQLAGVLMLGVGNLVYFAAVSIIFLRLFGDPAADEADAERASETTTAVELAGRPQG